jgi:putative NADH-flavin reductase
MRLLVVGSTGGTGRQVVAQALERGHEVTALARKPEKVKTTHPRLHVFPGDVLDPESLRGAVRDQDAVVCVLGHRKYLRPTSILSRGTANLIEAMRGAGVRRLVCQTSLGAGGSFGRLGLYYTLFVVPVVLQFYFWDKHRQEKAVRASGLDWTIVRPAALTNGPRRGTFRHGEKVGSWVATLSISRADTAAFLLDEIEAPRYVRRAPAIANQPRWLRI